jgi:hypothetical protein
MKKIIALLIFTLFFSVFGRSNLMVWPPGQNVYVADIVVIHDIDTHNGLDNLISPFGYTDLIGECLLTLYATNLECAVICSGNNNFSVHFTILNDTNNYKYAPGFYYTPDYSKKLNLYKDYSFFGYSKRV